MTRSLVYRAMAIQAYARTQEDQDFWAPIAELKMYDLLATIDGTLGFKRALGLVTEEREKEVLDEQAAVQQQDVDMDAMINWLKEN